jgi:LacI family transcriptional regulator
MSEVGRSRNRGSGHSRPLPHDGPDFTQANGRRYAEHSVGSLQGMARGVMTAKLIDVARHAGVSTATVSRVLNDLGGVSDALAERVRTSCAALDYHPNVTARVLAGGRSKALGLWVPDVRNHFFMEIVSGVLEAAQEFGYLITFSSYVGEPRSRQQRHAAELLAAAPVGGAVLVGSRDRDPAVELFRNRGVPIVTVDHRPVDDTSDVVNIDNVAAAREAVAHLLASGYRRVGVIASTTAHMTSRDRVAGYRMALQDAGLSVETELEVHGEYDVETGYRGALQLLALPRPVDAVLAASNTLSLGALKALNERGVRVPEDVGVVGFDELPTQTPGAPSLTCIVQPTFALGNTATKLLIDRLEHPERHVRQQVVLRHHLRLGDTTRRSHNTV